MPQQPQLLIVVNNSVRVLHSVSDKIIAEYKLPCVSVNKDLSKSLIGQPNANHSRDTLNWISLKIKEIDKEPLLLQDFDLIFDPTLKLDPLVVFRQTSKNKKLLVLWPGNFNNNILSYASPEHAHFRTWANPGVEIIHV